MWLLNNLFRNIAFFLLFFCLNSQANSQVWEKAFFFETECSGVTVSVLDADENIYVAGEYCGRLTIQNQLIESKGQTDLFVAKFDKDLNLKSLVSFGDTGVEIIGKIALDLDGNILLSGYFTHQLIIDTLNLLSYGGSDYFVAKFDTLFKSYWALSFGTKNDDAKVAAFGGLAVDSKNNIICTSQFTVISETDTLKVADTVLFGKLEKDAFLASITLDGKVRWASVFSGKGYEHTTSVDLDMENNIFLAIDATGRIYYDNQQYDNPHIGEQNVVFKIDGSTGKVIWHWGFYEKEFGSLYMPGPSLDSFGNVYVVGGYYCRVVDVGGVILSEPFDPGDFKTFVAKIGSSGKTHWVKQIVGHNPGVDYVFSKNSNEIFVSGNYYDICIYEGDTVGYLGQRIYQGYLLKIDSLGKPQYFGTTSGTASANISQVSSFQNGDIFILGSARKGNLAFNNATQLMMSSDYNVFIAVGNTDSIEASISSEIIEKNANIYPNPCNNELIVDFAQPFGEVAFYNIVGHKILETKLKFGKNRIDTSLLLNGVYQVEIKDIANRISHFSIIKL